MNGPGRVDVDTYERQVSAVLDHEVAAVVAQGNDFQQRMHGYVAMGQPVPTQLFLGWADGLTRWAEHFRRHGPAADWLAKAGRPDVGRRLAAIIDDVSKAAVRYRGMAAQEAAGWQTMAQDAARINGQINDTWAGVNRHNAQAHALRMAQGRWLL